MADGPAHRAAWLPSRVASWKRPLLTHPVNRILHQQRSHTATAIAFAKTKHRFAFGEGRRDWFTMHSLKKTTTTTKLFNVRSGGGEVIFSLFFERVSGKWGGGENARTLAAGPPSRSRWIYFVYITPPLTYSTPRPPFSVFCLFPLHSPCSRLPTRTPTHALSVLHTGQSNPQILALPSETISPARFEQGAAPTAHPRTCHTSSRQCRGSRATLERKARTEQKADSAQN